MELWKVIKKDGTVFNVSSKGNIQVFDKKKGLFRTIEKFSLNGGHEGKHYLSTHGQYVHRLVAEAFISPIQEGYTVNHKDSNKLNNEASNLEIITRSENNKHAWNSGALDHLKVPEKEIDRRWIKDHIAKQNRQWFVLDSHFNILSKHDTQHEAASSIGVSRQAANQSFRLGRRILEQFYICRPTEMYGLMERVSKKGIKR